MKKRYLENLEIQGNDVLEDDEDEVYILDENGKSVKLEVPDDAADD